jgi:hypothetical protein
VHPTGYIPVLVLLLPARYDQKLFFGLQISCKDEYIKATFRGSSKGATRRWFLVDLTDLLEWSNKHLLLSWMDDKRKVPEMMPRLWALVDRVIELHAVGLEVCHCTEEFILRWIHPLGRRERPTYECLQFGDLTCNPLAGKTPFRFLIEVSQPLSVLITWGLSRNCSGHHLF